MRKARFCYNNYLDTDIIQYSSQQTSFPATNLVGDVRSTLWKPNGLFEITTSNQTVWVNATSFNIPVGSYTFATLATAFGTASGGLSLTLARAGSGLITISGSSFTLKLSTTTNAVWNSLGYFRTADETGTTVTADERAYSTGEWLKVDLGLAQPCHFAALIPEVDQVFSIDLTSATVRIQGNNVDLWTAPLVDEVMEVSYRGAFSAPASTATCRYWRIFIHDPTNNAISVAVAYIGSAYIPVDTNIATGFTRVRVDPSERIYSESGTLYSDRRPKYVQLSSMQVQFLKDADLTEIEQLVYDLGVDQPFFLCIDPDVSVSSSLEEMTHYVAVDGASKFGHILRGYYTLNLEFREVV